MFKNKKKLLDLKREITLTLNVLTAQRNDMRRLIEKRVYTPEELAVHIDQMYSFMIAKMLKFEEKIRE